VSARQIEQIKKVHDEIQSVNHEWPSESRELGDQYGLFLEKLLARAVGAREIIFTYAVAKTTEHGHVTEFSAVLFTERLLVVGSIAVPPIPPPYRPDSLETVS